MQQFLDLLKGCITGKYFKQNCRNQKEWANYIVGPLVQQFSEHMLFFIAENLIHKSKIH